MSTLSVSRRPEPLASESLPPQIASCYHPLFSVRTPPFPPHHIFYLNGINANTFIQSDRQCSEQHTYRVSPHRNKQKSRLRLPVRSPSLACSLDSSGPTSPIFVSPKQQKRIGADASNIVNGRGKRFTLILFTELF